MIPSPREFWSELLGRVQGPMKFRLVLQPVMAALFAIRAGLRDARGGRRPFLEALLREPGTRRERVRESWRDVGRVFVLAVAMDLAYQFFVIRAFRPLEAAFLAVVVALVPYLIFRGVVTRLFRR